MRLSDGTVLGEGRMLGAGEVIEGSVDVWLKRSRGSVVLILRVCCLLWCALLCGLRIFE